MFHNPYRLGLYHYIFNEKNQDEEGEKKVPKGFEKFLKKTRRGPPKAEEKEGQKDDKKAKKEENKDEEEDLTEEEPIEEKP